jgi:hypothetical protein
MRRKLAHCSHHKCLTEYFATVASSLYNNRFLKFTGGYHHFDSRLDEFYDKSDRFRIASVNNHVLDLDRLGPDFRISRFIRDPRDLVVSGYFYHKRGAEEWCHIVGPSDKDWKDVNGHVPEEMGREHSFATYLQSLSEEEGLLAEIEFRTHHFRSMGQWPADPRIKLFRYEEIVGNERKTFAELFSFYGISWPERAMGVLFADKYSAKKKVGTTSHIRNPQSGQWTKHFTPKVRECFEQRYGGMLKQLGYAA